MGAYQKKPGTTGAGNLQTKNCACWLTSCWVQGQPAAVSFLQQLVGRPALVHGQDPARSCQKYTNPFGLDQGVLQSANKPSVVIREEGTLCLQPIDTGGKRHR